MDSADCLVCSSPPVSGRVVMRECANGCGQLVVSVPDDPRPVYCPACEAQLYGADQHHETAKLFEPAPVQIPGQLPLA